MKKRLFSLALAVLLTLSTFSFGAFAEDTDVGTDVGSQYRLTFVVDTVTVGNDDEEVQVDIRVEKNGGIALVGYEILFDKDVLSLESAPVLGDFLNFTLESGPVQEGKHTATLFSPENIIGDGTLVTYTFKINPEAKSGTHEIKILTSGYVDRPDGSKTELMILDENGYPIVGENVSGGVTIPGYTVSYDANGGSGAPGNQIKDKNAFVYISSTLPVREGYSFLGWSADKNATSAEYKAGDKYSENANLALYAVWEKQEAIAGSIDVLVSSAEAKTGEEVELTISVDNHLGFNGLSFDVIYDNTKLDYVSYTQKMFFNGLMEVSAPDKYENKVNFQILAGAQNVVATGDLVTLKFKVLDEAEDGATEVAIVPTDAFCLAGANMEPATLTVSVTNGGVEIISQMPGDIDLDEDVDIDDAVLLFQHSLLPDLYPLGYKGSVDFNGDGNVDINDAVLVFQHSLLPDLYPLG